MGTELVLQSGTKMSGKDSLNSAEKRLNSYDAEIAETEERLRGLKAKRAALAGSLNLIRAELSESGIRPAERRAVSRTDLSITEKILEILGEHSGDGFETEALKDAIEAKWPGEVIKISSLRTNLSVLRGAEKLITREKKKWRLVDQTP